MTVGIPIWQDRVSPVFDTAARLMVMRRGRRRARELEREEFALDTLAPDALARSVVALGVDVLLCAAISEPLRLALERGGVRVEGDLCGEVEALLRAFHAGNWRDPEFQMPGCRTQHARGALGRRGPETPVAGAVRPIKVR
jgi:predicted Fe-Mo cluster-binding NifX family protein